MRIAMNLITALTSEKGTHLRISHALMQLMPLDGVKLAGIVVKIKPYTPLWWSKPLIPSQNARDL